MLKRDTHKALLCVCVFTFPAHVPPGLNWANSERGFCPFHGGIMSQAPMQIILYVCKYGLESLGRAASFHLCTFCSVQVCALIQYVCVCICLLSSHASRHGCFLLSCGSPFVFSSGCWLLSRCCSSCCSTLSSTGNFWSRWSSVSLCFHCMDVAGLLLF